MSKNLDVPQPAALWLLASAFCDAGKLVLAPIRSGEYEGGHAFVPCVFLFFRSVELSLKVVLAEHGVTEREIARQLGHAIEKLVAKVETLVPLNTFGIDDRHKDMLVKYSRAYSGKGYEYPGNFWHTPDIDDLMIAAETLCNGVRYYRQT